MRVSVQPSASPDLELLCPECDYNLTGNLSAQCPWCGWEIDVDQLIASQRMRHGGGRLGVAASGIVVGTGSLIGFWSLLGRDRPLSMWDAIAALAVVAPSVGHITLAGMAIFSKGLWPLRRGEAAGILRVIALMSIVTAFLGARPALGFGPTPNIVHGVQVNGVLEFFAFGLFASFPAAMLLLLTVIAFRPMPRLRGKEGIENSIGSAPPISINFARIYERQQVRSSWSNETRVTDASMEAHIDSVWERESKLAIETGRRLYNGELVRLVDHNVDPAQLRLTFGGTTYREFLGTNLYDPQALFKENRARSNALGVSALLLTADGFLALGRRGSDVSFHAGHLHTFGGLVDVTDLSEAGNVCVFRALQRELHEEMLIRTEDITQIVITGLVRDNAIAQPELVFAVSVRLTREQLRHNLSSISNDNEHTAIEFVPDEPDSIVPFLARSAPVAPVAQAAILLHGLHHWGQSWYEQTCYVLYGDLPGFG